MGEESKKYSSFRMCLYLSDNHLNTRRYSYQSTYMNPMVTTNQKPPVDTQKLKRKEHNHTTKENHQAIREETKRK